MIPKQTPLNENSQSTPNYIIRPPFDRGKQSNNIEMEILSSMVLKSRTFLGSYL